MKQRIVLRVVFWLEDNLHTSQERYFTDQDMIFNLSFHRNVTLFEDLLWMFFCDVLEVRPSIRLHVVSMTIISPVHLPAK